MMTLLCWLLLFACTSTPSAPTPPSEDGVWALAYGRSTFRASQILKGAPKEERWPFSWQIWLIHLDNRWILVDTGFRDPALARKWKIKGFRPAVDVLAEVGVKAEQISDVIITHAHWDHIGGVSDFPNATVWIQADEWAWLQGRVSPEHPHRSGLRQTDRQILEAIAAAGRLKTPNGDAAVMPNVRLHRSGGHTPGVQWVEVRLPDGVVVLASDIAYHHRNLTEGPPGGSHNPEADRAAIEEMKALSERITPGHDPQTTPQRGLNRL